MLLLGREAERARLDELVGDARRGKSGSLLVRGQPGVGKSALLQLATELAAGFTILTARGLETDSELAFSGLGDLFRLVHRVLDRIPAPQAAALAGALAIGPPVPGDRFAVYAATLSALAAAAEEAPVLAVVDDLHWLDSASAEALLFTARRLENEGVALLFAWREGEPMRVDISGVPSLAVTGLEAAHAVQLLEQTPGRRIAPSVAQALAKATDGNPLALREVPSLLSTAQLAGAEALPEPPPAGRAIERAFMRRVAPLAPETRRALVIAAASESGDMATIAPALASIGLAASDLEVAEGAGLARITAHTMAFNHPLLRSAIYHAASPAERRLAHRALANALGEDVHGATRRAWHLAAAALGPDDHVASLLEQAANDARSRSGYAAAASALERAARLSTNRDDALRRLTAAGEAARFAGQTERAVTLLEAALSLDPGPIARAQIQSLRGQTMMWRDKPLEAHRILVDEAQRIMDQDPGLAMTMLLHAVGPAIMDSQVVKAVRTARLAHELGSRLGGPGEAASAANLGEALLLHGEAAEGEPLILRSIELSQHGDPGLTPLVFYYGFCLLAMERYDEGRRLLEPMLAACRSQAMLGLLPYPLAVMSEFDFRTGHWDAAYAAASESLLLAGETGQESQMSYSLGCLARIEAARGDAEACRRHAMEAMELATRHRTSSIFCYGHAALGLLELGFEDYAAAFDQLESAWRFAFEHDMFETNVVQYFPDLVEAAIRLGREQEAAALLNKFEALGRSTGRNWTLACAARCRGLLAQESDAEAHFVAALARHRQTPTPFEEARTELCFGEVLRRQRQRVEAREHLRNALDIFERLRAQPWMRRATAELNATGEHARSRKAPATRDLTPQELRVALVIADGTSNQDAAARLFLSPKTIEAHLTSVYSKLGIRSRVQLARLVAAEHPSAALMGARS